MRIESALVSKLTICYDYSSKNRLLTVSEDVMKNVTTINKLRALFDNYEMDALLNEKEDAVELKEQDAFISAVLNTNVMKTLMQFLVKKE